jgi:DnaK suppressor protein
MSTRITSEELAALKQQLLDEQAHLQKERGSYRSDEMNDTEVGAISDLAHSDPSDSADEGTNLFDRDRDRATIENADRILAKIARALQKMEEGTYGFSDVNGTPIPIARLRVLPYALATVEQEEQGS